MAVHRFDHVAVSVPDLAAARRLFEGPLGMTLRRTGVRHATGAAIAIVGDDLGTKIELVEEPDTVGAPMHLAFQVDDVEEVGELLTSAHDCEMLRPKVWLDSARADFCTVLHASGLRIQLVRYDDDSPDL